MRDRARCEVPLARAAAALAVLALAPASASLAQDWTGHAVIVGISDYPGTANDLDWCDDDAREVRDTLLSDGAHWSADNVRLLVNGAAGYAAIQTAVSQEFAEATQPGDVCLFFFSGHGTEVTDADGDEAAGDTDDEVIVAHDMFITDDDLATWFGAHDGKRICAIFDVCRAGGMAKSVDPSSDLWNADFASDVMKALPAHRAGPTSGDEAPGSPPAPPKTDSAATRDVQDTGQAGIVMLMACEDVQLSEEDAILRNGVFSFYVIEALRRRSADADGNGHVSGEEAFAYAYPLVVAWNPDQTPELYDTHAGELDVITAADRPLDRIVTEKDFPFGGDGCSRGDGGAMPWGGILLAGVAALLLRRRRAAAALALAFLLLPGCGGDALGEETGRFSFRAGLVSPFAEREAPYSSGVQVGVSYRGPLPRDGVEFEFGGGASFIDGDGYDVEATILRLSGDLVLSRRDPALPWIPYVAAGPRVLYAGVSTYWGSGLDGAWGVGLAAGLRQLGKGADFRASVDWLPGSGNIEGVFGLTAGWSF
ncbi:MAG: caspase family protein [Planctomycetota bacterium]|jgi:hypothetical protein